MNESQTRIEKIDPQLHQAGWGIVEDSRILTEVTIAPGRISAVAKPHPMKADYVLQYKGANLAVIEAKSDEKVVGDGVAQAKKYAKKLAIRYTYATNGDEIYFMDMETGDEKPVSSYPTPQELWEMTFGDVDEWRDRFYEQPFFYNGIKRPRFYQEIAVNKVLTAIAEGKKRILLTLATGTGKTFIASQICYKLVQTRWNIKKTGTLPRILFLSDRTLLSDQALIDFDCFKADEKTRINPNLIKEKGKMPKNSTVFFTLFKTFVSERNGKANFGAYSRDFFDLVIIDECHRGGANDESTWHKILEYFDTAVQLGLTATPRRDVNTNTYRYFGEPVYQYSLVEGINDGFLTPYRFRQIQSNIDDYIYTPDDDVLSGEVEEGKVYYEADFFNGKIEIRERDMARVKEFMEKIHDEKTIVFCSTENHAAQVRDMINQVRKGNPFYAARVTSHEGNNGETMLNEFKDNEKTIPTMLTTSRKLSTGVDVPSLRNIVLLRPVKSMVEFKQILGRGTRLYEGKYFFTVYDFVKAYERFNDVEWDGDPVCPICGNYPCTCEKGEGGEKKPPRDNHRPCPVCGEYPCVCPPKPCPVCGQYPCVCKRPEKIKIRLSDGKTRNIKHIVTDMFWGGDGKPITVEEFLNSLFGKMPEFFTSQDDLREKWSNPDTREHLLDQMEEAGYGREELMKVREVIDAENSDLIDVLEFVAYNIPPKERVERAERAKSLSENLSKDQHDFVNYVLQLYVHTGIEELKSDKLGKILEMKFGSIPEGITKLGGIEVARNTFANIQRNLYIQ